MKITGKPIKDGKGMGPMSTNLETLLDKLKDILKQPKYVSQRITFYSKKKNTKVIKCSKVYLRSVFHFHLHFYRHTSYFPYFIEYVPLFLDDNIDEECE